MRRLRFFSIFFVVLLGLLAPIALTLQSGMQINTADASALDLAWSFIKDPLATGSSMIFGSLVAALGMFINGIAYVFLSIAGLMFDSLIHYAIVDFGTTLSLTTMTAINMVWSAFRDITNIVIIGMFVFVAFATILNQGHYNIKQFAVKICIAALLINFSLFFTKAVIDVSNFVAFQFYKGMSSLQVQNTNGTNSGIGIASRLMSSVGISGASVGGEMLSGGSLLWENVGTNFVAVLTTSIGLFLFLSFATVILFYGVFQLVYRVVLLMLLMSVSALAVGAYIVPRFKTYQEQWLAALLQQAIFAPLLMMMLWAIVAISDALVGSINRSHTLSQAMAKPGDPGAATVFINYLVICGLLFGAIKLSSSLSAKSDSLLFGVGGWLKQKAANTSEQGFTAAAQRIRDRRINRSDTQLAQAESAMKSALKNGTQEDYANARKNVDKIKSRISTTGDFRDTAVMKALAKIAKVPVGKPEKKTMADEIKKKRGDEDKKATEAADIVRAFNDRASASKAAAEQQVKALEDAKSKETRAVTEEIKSLGTAIKEKKEKEGEKVIEYKEKEKAHTEAENVVSALEKGNAPLNQIETARRDAQQRSVELKSVGGEIQKIRDEINQKSQEMVALGMNKDARIQNVESEFFQKMEADKKLAEEQANAVRAQAKVSIDSLLNSMGEKQLSERSMDNSINRVMMDKTAYSKEKAREGRVAERNALVDAVKEVKVEVPSAPATTHTASAGGSDMKPAGGDHH